MELTDYLRILRAHWIGVLVLTLVAGMSALVFSLLQDKVYAANANGFVSSGLNDNPALASVSDSLAKSRAKSYVDIAQSRATAETVIEDLDLDVSPASLIGSIDVEQPIDTVLIKVTARAGTPLEAQQLADSWIAALAQEVAAIEDPTGKNEAGTLQVVPVESAALPTSPVSPQTERNVLLGLVLGLLLGLGYAVLRSQLDRRIRSATAVEQRYGVTVVGAIPGDPDLQHEHGDAAHIAVFEETEARQGAGSAEAFRKLRTNLQFMDIDNPPRVIVVTSPQQGDGKSTVAANLAAAVAASGETVTLVDGDLRRSSVAQSFGLVEGVGLTDVLVGRVDVADVIQQPEHHTNLRILGAGAAPPNPSELLGSQTMRGLLRQLAADSIVIVDAPPLLPVTDAAVLTAVTDGAFVVISSGKTLDTELESALGHIEAVSGRTLGVVFNRVTRKDSDSGYYGGYYRADSAPAAAAPVRPSPTESPAATATPVGLSPTESPAPPAVPEGASRTEARKPAPAGSDPAPPGPEEPVTAEPPQPRNGAARESKPSPPPRKKATKSSTTASRRPKATKSTAAKRTSAKPTSNTSSGSPGTSGAGTSRAGESTPAEAVEPTEPTKPTKRTEATSADAGAPGADGAKVSAPDGNPHAHGPRAKGAEVTSR